MQILTTIYFAAIYNSTAREKQGSPPPFKGIEEECSNINNCKKTERKGKSEKDKSYYRKCNQTKT